MSTSLFTLAPTFTQGLILGQFSILILLALILKYLFFDSQSSLPYVSTPYAPPITEKERTVPRTKTTLNDADFDFEEQVPESAAWFNIVLKHVVETYRSKLRDDKAGSDGDEIARERVQRYANKIRPPGFVDSIKILSLDLGSSAPRLSNARRRPRVPNPETVDKIEFDMTYTDTISVSLTTSVLFNYPIAYFARLPISLTVSLALFSSTVLVTPPEPLSTNPTLNISITPDFTLELKTTSLMGSRAKLADVPKLHEMIQAQARRVLAQRATWKVVMPWISNVEEVQDSVSH